MPRFQFENALSDLRSKYLMKGRVQPLLVQLRLTSVSAVESRRHCGTIPLGPDKIIHKIIRGSP